MKSLTLLVLLMALATVPGVQGVNESETLEDAVGQDDCVPRIAPFGIGGERPRPGVFLPQIRVCQDIAGECTVQEYTEILPNSSGYHVYMDVAVTVYPVAFKTTLLQCSGSATVSTLTWGGVGARSVYTLFGQPLEPDAAPEVAALPSGSTALTVSRDPATCEYLAQATQCLATHTVDWVVNRAYSGIIKDVDEGIHVCAPLDVYNAAGVAVPPGTPVVGSILAPEYHWEHEICAKVPTVAAQF